MQGVGPCIPALSDGIGVALPVDAGGIGDLVAVAAQLPELQHHGHRGLHRTEQWVGPVFIVMAPEADPQGQQPAVPAQHADSLVACRKHSLPEWHKSDAEGGLGRNQRPDVDNLRIPEENLEFPWLFSWRE